MAIELKVPNVGESITEVVIGEWLVAVGDRVEVDDNLVVIETDKVNVELPAPEAGVITEIRKQAGDDASVGEVIGLMDGGGDGDGDKQAKGDAKKSDATKGDAKKSDATKDDAKKSDAKKSDAKKEQASGEDEVSEEAAPESDEADEEEREAESDEDDDTDEAPAADKDERGDVRVTPAARRLLAEARLEASDVVATGPGGRLLKEDVNRHLAEKKKAGATERSSQQDEPKQDEPKRDAERPTGGAREEKVVPMTTLRKRVAERLVEAQRTAAILTTFNEVDMSRVMALRKQYQDRFVERYGMKLGFMSFFVKAVIEALKEVPRLNAEIRGTDIVYRNYFDIGVAVGGGKGLVVPVVRDAEQLSFAEVEQAIADLATRAKDNKLTLSELQGGTFTISNGGIYGSLLSTPILNPPQSGILGMHKIEERPVAIGGEVVIRPMMYVALSYDHRLVDGREAVTFLVRVKESIEDPTRLLLEV